MRDLSGKQSGGWAGRIALATMVLIGGFLIALPLATNLPGKSSDTGAMMTAFRPQMSDAALAQGRADQQTMAAMGEQLSGQMLPALAQQMHMSPAELSAYMAANYPAVTTGMAEFGTIMPFFGNLQSTMEAQQSNYQQADQIPTGFLPPTSMTWLFVVPGLALVLLGGYGLARPRRTAWMVAASGAVGAVMIIGLLAVSMYGKASSADEMNSTFQPVFASQNVQQARADTNTVEAMATELSQKAFPGLAAGLHVTPQQLSASVAQQFPAVATGMAQLPQIVQRMETATLTIEQNVGNYASATSIPWSPGSMVSMFWFMMGPAIAILCIVCGWFGLSLGRRTVPQFAAAGTRTGAAHS